MERWYSPEMAVAARGPGIRCACSEYGAKQRPGDFIKQRGLHWKAYQSSKDMQPSAMTVDRANGPRKGRSAVAGRWYEVPNSATRPIRAWREADEACRAFLWLQLLPR